jgi:hypothetical protein
MSGRSEERRAVITGPGMGSFELRPGGSLRIGRHHENDIVIKDSVVSRFHATLRWDPEADRPILQDNGSQNGTNVNGKDVIGSAEPIGSQTRVVIGSYRLTVELLGTEASALIEDAGDAVALYTEQGPGLRGAFDATTGLRQLMLRLEVEVRSGTLKLELTGRPGPTRLTVAAGRVMEVQHGELRGLPALDQIYQATNGTYQFTRDMEPCDEPLNIRYSEYLRQKHGSYLGTTKWIRDLGEGPPTRGRPGGAPR